MKWVKETLSLHKKWSFPLRISSLFVQWILCLLAHLFPIHPFFIPWKQKNFFWCFHGAEKGCTGSKWLNRLIYGFDIKNKEKAVLLGKYMSDDIIYMTVNYSPLQSLCFRWSMLRLQWSRFWKKLCNSLKASKFSSVSSTLFPMPGSIKPFSKVCQRIKLRDFPYQPEWRHSYTIER